MSREEARARVIEDSETLVNMGVNADGSINAHATGVLSAVNSTATPLGISGVFNGTGEEVLNYAQITVFVYTDQDSGVDGLRLESSTDNTNWDDADVYTITANTGKVFTLGPNARYFRIVYTNGTSAQTALRLQTIYRYVRTKPSSHRLVDNLSAEDDAELMRAVISGLDILTNESTNIQARDNRLLVSQDVEAPAGTTPVTIEAFADTGDTIGLDTYYTITNGATLTIQQLSAGSESESGGSIVELFEDLNGDLSVLNRIDQIFTNGSSNQIEINSSFIGDGTNRIVLRQRTYTGSAREVSGRWIGFEE